MPHQCQACGHELTLEVKVARLDRCDNCDADLHCCKNCRFYDEGGDRCREDIRNFERYRDRANFCQSFTFRNTESSRADEIQDARSRLAALFKNI